MELYILNKDLELLNILDTLTSLIWTRRYYRTGTFALHCPLNDKTIQLLTNGNIIYKGGLEAGYIETRQLKRDATGQEIIEVQGKFLTGYLNQRINWGRVDFNGLTENLMRQLVIDNAISPSNNDRKIDNLILGDLQGFNDTIKYQNSFGNILTCLENISNTSNLGYRNLFDFENRKIVFDIYKGINRTVGNGIIAPTIFSRDFENILEQEYFDSVNNFKNTALIAGAGEGEDRRITEIEIGQGLNRYEIFVDARDIEDKEDEQVMNDSEYLPLLIQRGHEKLAEHEKIQTFDSKVDLDGNNVYKEDFDLGDIVTVVDNEWGIKVDTRITEITEVYEEKGFDVRVVFGNNIPTLLDKIRQVIK